MTLYFTGSGNSKYVADALGDQLDDRVISLNRVMKRQIGAPLYTSETPFVVVFPIHTWNMPDVVIDLLRRASFSGNNRIYFVATMEAETGRADEYCQRLATGLGLRYMGFTGIPMPTNCAYLEKMPSNDQAWERIEASRPLIQDAAHCIAKGGRLSKTDHTSASRVKSGTVMHALYKRFIMTDSGYTVLDACIGCGACERRCPLNNIEMKDGRPQFKGNCCSCYACIQCCPQQAIEIKGHSEGHGRYVCPPYVSATSD